MGLFKNSTGSNSFFNNGISMYAKSGRIAIFLVVIFFAIGCGKVSKYGPRKAECWASPTEVPGAANDLLYAQCTK